ncbi:MAG TPA: hypothetical protein VKA67_02710, partial [Verrucomicrobiae bacterium]|nr:hypothetical protein [Verrucomicrobiae bacterium]
MLETDVEKTSPHHFDVPYKRMLESPEVTVWPNQTHWNRPSSLRHLSPSFGLVVTCYYKLKSLATLRIRKETSRVVQKHDAVHYGSNSEID